MKKICENCKKEFNAHHATQKFCSIECVSNQKKFTLSLVECEFSGCTNTFYVKKQASVVKRFCSRKCQSEWQKTSQLGEKNGNFGKRKPGMYRHTKEEKEIISAKVAESWNKPERLVKHLAFFERHRLPNGKIDWITDEMRENISKKNIERLINCDESFAYINCKKGYYYNKIMNHNEFYHSSWELDRMVELDSNCDVLLWTKQHKIVISYPYNGITCRYYPDFFIEYKNGNIVIEEIKGYVKDIERLKVKILYAKKYCYENGFEYVIDFKKNSKNYKKIIEWEKKLNLEKVQKLCIAVV